MPATALNLARVPDVESSWKPEQIAESLEVVRRNAKTFANEAVDWYYVKKNQRHVLRKSAGRFRSFLFPLAASYQFWAAESR